MRRGRKARLEKPPEASAIRAGMPGGSYRPLSDHDMAQMNHAILEILEKIGMADPIPIYPKPSLRSVFTPELFFGQATHKPPDLSKPSGAARRSRLCPSLMPSFLGREVPE